MRSFRFLTGLFGLFAAITAAFVAFAALLFRIPGDILDRVRMLALELAPKLARDTKARRLAFIARFEPGPAVSPGPKYAAV